MADDTTLGLGVTFTASVEGFSKQLDVVKAQLEQFAKQLESLGATADKSGKTLTNANLQAEQSINKVTEATKEAVVATEEANKVAATLQATTKKSADNSKEYSRSIKETREALKGLDAATISQVHTANNTALSWKAVAGQFAKAEGSSRQFKQALASVAIEAQGNVERFKQLSGALFTNEKVIMQADASYKKLRSTLGTNVLPTYTQEWAKGLDRVRMAQSSLNGELFRSDSGIALTKGNFVSLQKELIGLKKSYGDAAWSAIEADKRLGSGISTVAQLRSELSSYQKIQASSNKYTVEAGKAVEATAISMNALGQAGTRWAEGVDKSAVASAFMKNQIVNANGSLMEMGKTVYETGDRVSKMRDKFNDLSDNTFNKIRSQLGTNITTWQEFGTALQKSSDRAQAAQERNAALGQTHRDLTNVAGASTKAIDFFQQAVQKGSITGEQAVNALKNYTGRMADIKAAAGSVIDQQTRLNASYQELNNSTGKFKTQYDSLLTSLDGSKTGFFTTNENIKRLNASFLENEKGVKSWNEAIRNVGTITPITGDRITRLQSAIDNGTMSHKEAVKSLNTHVTALGKLAAATEKPTGFMAGLSQSILGGASAASKATGFFARLGTAVGSLAAWIPAAMIISTLTEAITGAITAVKEYDQALKSLQAISGGTEAEIGLLGKEMLRVSDSTKYSASEIAKGAIYIAQAGFTAGESLQVIAAAARGAQGTMEPLTTAADLLTTVIRAFHIDADQASVVMDKLAMAANKSKTDLEGMKVVFNYLGPAAFSAGVSLNETLGTLMALSNVGMRMSTVGTSLRQVFIGLENPSAKLKAALQSLGMSVDDLSVKKMGSLEKVLQNLDKVIGGSLTNAVQFFNVRAGNAALVISQMNAHVAMMIQYTKEYGAAAAMADTQTKGLSVQISMLSNQFQNFIIRIAEGGLTDAFKAFIEGAKGFIKILEFLITNPISNFIITIGTMAAALLGLRAVFYLLGNAITTVLVGASLEASLTAIKTVGAMTALRDVFSGLILIIGNVGKAIYSLIVFFFTMGTSTAAYTSLIGALKAAWISLSAAFAASPVGIVVTGLALISAAIYTLIVSAEKQSKAIQELAITYSNNERAATRFAEKLREIKKEQSDGKDVSDSYVAVLKDIRKTFPEVTAELVRNSNNLEAQAVALDKVAQNYGKLNDAAAKSAIGDLVSQFQKAGYEASVFSDALRENRNQLVQIGYGVAGVVSVLPSFLGSLVGMESAVKLNTWAWAQMQLAWNTSSSEAGVEAAEKLSASLNKQRELYPQLTSVIVNSSRDIRESLINMIPEGEMKKATLGAVAMHDKMVASLKVGVSEAIQKDIDAVAEMGQRWIEYYERQETMGRAEVASMATNSKKKIEAEMKAFEKANSNSESRINERLRLEDKYYTEMLEKRGKLVETLLKLEDKLYEEQHKKRKTASEVELQQLDLLQKQELIALGNKGLKEDEYLKKKEALEKEYFERNIKAIEASTKAEIDSLDNVHKAKLATLDAEKDKLDPKAAADRKISIETEYTGKLIAIYREQMAQYKTHISGLVSEHTKYKTEYDKNLKDIQRLEEAHLKALETANKKYLKDKSDISLANSKLKEDISKLEREAVRSTMTTEEAARDKVNEFNETLAKGYDELYKAETAADSLTKKEKVKSAQDYFKEAQSMIRGLVRENTDAEGKITLDKEATKRAQLGFYAEIKEAADRASAADVAARNKEREETIEADRAKKDALIATLNEVNAVAEKNMKATTEQISEMMMKYNDFAAKVSEMIVVKADTTKTYEELDKLIKHATDLNKSKSLEIVLSFMGKASDQTFLGEKITQITGWLTTLSDLITGKVREYLVNFKGFDNGWFWLGSLIDNLIVKLNNLYTAANRSATFTTNYVTNGVPPTTSGNSTTTVESGGGGGGYEYADNSGSVGLVDSIQYAAEGGSIPGTGTGDTVPAMLTPGEFVVKAPVVRGLGEGFFHFVNSLKSFSVPRFNMGGLVQSFAGGGLVKNREVFTLNLQSGSATLPLTVMGKPSSVRQSLRQFEKEISRMRLSRG